MCLNKGVCYYFKKAMAQSESKWLWDPARSKCFHVSPGLGWKLTARSVASTARFAASSVTDTWSHNVMRGVKIQS